MKTWEGYLIASQVSSTLGASTPAQDLLRKRYVGIAGSNKLIGALEMQQVGVYQHRLTSFFHSLLQLLQSLSFKRLACCSSY